MLKSRLLKTKLGLSTAVLALSAGFAPMAKARSNPDLEARIAALEAMIAELRQEVAAGQASDAEQVVRVEQIEAQVAAAPAAPAPADVSGFMAGNTRITMGGFVDADYHVTELSDGDFAPTSIARDFYIPGATPIGGSGDSRVDNDFTAKGTRFFFATTTPTENGDISGRLEFDFLGSPGGNERVSNSYNPRLRAAWLQYGNWRMGQDWSTFQNTGAIPESASFLVASDGMVFVRQAQLRYTSGNWQVALENPDTTITPFGGGARIDGGDGAIPDLVVRYNQSGDFGSFSIAGLARNLTYEGADSDDSTFGWGLSASGRINLGEGSDLRFSLSGGEGMGRYIGLNAANGAVMDGAGGIEAIPSFGGLVALRQSLGDGRRFNVGYSHLEIDNDIALSGSSATASVYSGFANYMVTLAPGVTAGAEILFGERELESGATGSISRATFSTKYTF